MAIIKTSVTPQGVSATYHKLVKIEISSSDNIATCVVAIFTSAEARETGCTPLWHEYVTIPLGRFSTDPREIFYPLLAEYESSYLVGGEPDQPVGDAIIPLLPLPPPPPMFFPPTPPEPPAIP